MDVQVNMQVTLQPGESMILTLASPDTLWALDAYGFQMSAPQGQAPLSQLAVAANELTAISGDLSGPFTFDLMLYLTTDQSMIIGTLDGGNVVMTIDGNSQPLPQGSWTMPL